MKLEDIFTPDELAALLKDDEYDLTVLALTRDELAAVVGEAAGEEVYDLSVLARPWTPPPPPPPKVCADCGKRDPKEGRYCYACARRGRRERMSPEQLEAERRRDRERKRATSPRREVGRGRRT